MSLALLTFKKQLIPMALHTP